MLDNMPIASHRQTVDYHNRILSALPEDVRQRLEPHLTLVHLPLAEIIQQKEQPVEHVYFVESGLVSLVTNAGEGRQIEIGVIGHEGLVGASLVLGPFHSLHCATVQVPLTAHRLPASKLNNELQQATPDSALRVALSHNVHLLLAQVAQSAVCNRTHTIEERLSRWLLMVSDRIQTDGLPLANEFLSHMLGVRRSGVALALGVLQQAGLIDATQGHIVIINRNRLEQTACDCYKIVRRHFLHFETALRGA